MWKLNLFQLIAELIHSDGVGMGWKKAKIRIPNRINFTFPNLMELHVVHLSDKRHNRLSVSERWRGAKDLNSKSLLRAVRFSHDYFQYLIILFSA